MKNPFLPIRQRLVSYLNRGTVVPSLNDVQHNSGELIVDLSSEDQVRLPDKSHLMGLASWVEREGFLFFDALQIPHPAGFKAGEQKLYPYVQTLNTMFNSLVLVEDMIDYATQTVSNLLNDPEKLASKSIKSDINSLHNTFDHKSISMLADMYKPYFDNSKQSDRASFAELFNNAQELTRTANELAYLNDRIGGHEYAKKINSKLARLSELCIEFNEEYPDHPVRSILVTHLVSPLAYWAEFLAAYLYNINVLNVCFSEIEEKLAKMKKEK